MQPLKVKEMRAVMQQQQQQQPKSRLPQHARFLLCPPVQIKLHVAVTFWNRSAALRRTKRIVLQDRDFCLGPVGDAQAAQRVRGRVQFGRHRDRVVVVFVVIAPRRQYPHARRRPRSLVVERFLKAARRESSPQHHSKRYRSIFSSLSMVSALLFLVEAAALAA